MKALFSILGVMMIGLTLGAPTPVQAQTSKVKLADVVGTWQPIPELTTWTSMIYSYRFNVKGQVDRDSIKHVTQSLIIQPDGTMLGSAIQVHKGDTLFCGGVSRNKATDINLSLDKDAGGTQQLIINGEAQYGASGKRAVYKRVAASPVKPQPEERCY